MRKTTVTSRDDFFPPTEIPHDRHEQGGIGRNGDRVVVPAVEEICKSFGTMYMPSITITLKADLCSEIVSSSSTTYQG